MKYLCIHGHYYQPPRENPWLEVLESQESAYPYHDWNERINAECYAPNSASRILDEKHLIRDIVNNYAKISFNFGPTLLSWLEEKDKETYQAILKADKESLERFSGHGTAIAQVYSHSIMPLNNARDKETQTIWGIKDFETRFGRKPEGIWLAETAVDTATLEVLVDNDIKYTILAPRQAKAIRINGSGQDWNQLGHAAIDPRRAYICNLPSGRTINLFFYDGNVAQDVAFKGILNSGKAFANRLTSTLDQNPQEAQLAHIATDGESYGHHHRFGEMALADCLNTVEKTSDIKLTNYGEFLELHPPTYEVQIHENSSWSCVHGVERWRSNCGCHTGGGADWNQKWRAPLRDALDWLRDHTNTIYEAEASKLLKDIWAARNDFIHVVLDRSDESVDAFLAKHVKKPLGQIEKVKTLRLLEMQRNEMLMYTSCGWFFNDISGLETVQILKYACRVIYYARQIANVDFEKGFIEKLSLSPVNIDRYKNGAELYIEEVLPIQVDLESTGIHYAIMSLFEEKTEELQLFNHVAKSIAFERRKAGGHQLIVGKSFVKSKITHSRKRFSFAVLYLGQQNIIGNIAVGLDDVRFEKMQNSLIAAFENSQTSEMISIMQTYFGPKKYGISSLFKDEKIKILELIFNKNLGNIERELREIYDDNYQLMNTFSRNGLPLWRYTEIVRYVLNADLRQYFDTDLMSVKELRRITRQKEKWNIQFEERKVLLLKAETGIVTLLLKLKENPNDIDLINNINTIFNYLERLDLKPEVWKAQNIYFEISKRTDLPKEEVWNEAFTTLGQYLGVRRN